MYKRNTIITILITAVLLAFVFSGHTAMAEDAARNGRIVNCTYGVNVRSGPGTGYSKLGVAPKGTVYSILGKSGLWYKLNFQGSAGYVSSNYISLLAGAPASPALGNQTGKIINCTSGVNVRSGPGTGYTKLGVAPKGTIYTVKGKSGSYYAIDYNGRSGYVYEGYILLISMPAPTPNLPAEGADKIIVGYYGSWAAYSGYTPDQIPTGVTHLHYAFANIGADFKIKLGDTAIDSLNFEKLRLLKRQRPDLKTMISVGGWTWSDKFSDVALTDARRTAFADSVVTFIRQHGFDGVDIDWEYPVSGGLPANITRPEDKTNFTLLLAKLREKLDTQGALDGRSYLLSFAGASGSFYASNTELKKLAGYVNYATIMTYDMHGPWPGSVTDLNAPLYTPSENTPQYKWSCNAAVNRWADEGFPKNKMVMGIPFYGVQFNGVTNAGRGLYQTFTSGSSISYDKIVSTYLSNPAYTRYEHLDARVPWLFDGTTFISYDDPQSVSAKARYIKDTGLGGAAIWELSQNVDGTLFDALYDSIR